MGAKKRSRGSWSRNLETFESRAGGELEIKNAAADRTIEPLPSAAAARATTGDTRANERTRKEAGPKSGRRWWRRAFGGPFAAPRREFRRLCRIRESFICRVRANSASLSVCSVRTRVYCRAGPLAASPAATGSSFICPLPAVRLTHEGSCSTCVYLCDFIRDGWPFCVAFSTGRLVRTSADGSILYKDSTIFFSYQVGLIGS